MSVELPDRQSLGDLLIQRKALTEEELNRAIDAQGASLLPLGSTIIKLGLADEPTVAGALAEQYGVPAIDLNASSISTSVLAVLPKEVAQHHQVLPLAFEGEALHLAVGNPGDQALLDEIAFATGKNVLTFVSPKGVIEGVIEAAYGAYQEGESQWKGSRAESAEPGLVILHPTRGPGEPTESVDIDQELVDTSFGGVPVPKEAGPRVEGKPRVLAVDDEHEILDLIETLLTHRGMEVIRASHGREALELLRATQPDLVLLDAMLPEIHGFEICSSIKRSEQYKHIPVIMISAIYKGFNFIQDVKRIHGADDYITKPFKVADLVRRVDELLAGGTGKAPPQEFDDARRNAVEESARASKCLKDGAVTEALDAAGRAVHADPFDPRCHFLLGAALHRVGRIYEAISEYERVIELAPGEFSALKNLAVLYERQGFKSKAVELWMRAMDQSPSEPVRKTIKAHLIGLL